MSPPPDRSTLFRRLRWFFRQLAQLRTPFTRLVVHLGPFLAVPTGLILAAALALFWGPALTEAHIRWTGLWLEIAGVAIVLWELRGRGKHREPGTRSRLGRAWDDLRAIGRGLRSAFRGPRAISIKASPLTVKTHVDGRMKLRKGAPADATPEQRIEVLEARAADLEREVDSIETDLRIARKEAREAVDREQAVRAGQVAEVRSELANLATGNLHLEWVGVVWVLIGVFLATGAPEFAIR